MKIKLSQEQMERVLKIIVPEIVEIIKREKREARLRDKQ
ncbi:hypothetical protein SAMN06295960_4138 [Paenibacillus aquistagni]|uniref:Uncharacterized protein n=1 Tax=Paenibacillus aquistagni TaxID=1852522 RepID=A0A1X7LT18_9BACL|nr:hypothetical protein SAMN06295960_4138 [Paenibacillus aquistagni]